MDLRYPIGQFAVEQDLTEHQIQGWIREIAKVPENLRQAVDGLTDAQLDTPYRPGGWTVRQVVHHVPDSHMNSYIRFKLALTEDTPQIKPYHENLWAELDDSKSTPIETSLALLDNLHERWVILLNSLTPSDYKRAFVHPESGTLPLDHVIGLYAWHGKHHVAHIVELRKRMEWS